MDCLVSSGFRLVLLDVFLGKQSLTASLTYAEDLLLPKVRVFDPEDPDSCSFLLTLPDSIQQVKTYGWLVNQEFAYTLLPPSSSL